MSDLVVTRLISIPTPFIYPQYVQFQLGLANHSSARDDGDRSITVNLWITVLGRDPSPSIWDATQEYPLLDPLHSVWPLSFDTKFSPSWNIESDLIVHATARAGTPDIPSQSTFFFARRDATIFDPDLGTVTAAEFWPLPPKPLLPPTVIMTPLAGAP